MIRITDIPGRETVLGGEAYLFFSGFAYLGMPSLERFQAAVTEGTRRYGAVYPSSRLSNTPSGLYEDLESELAAYTGREEAASFSSGYLASQAAAIACAEGGSLLLCPGTHPSLVPGGVSRRVFEGPDWQAEMAAFVQASSGSLHTIVLESVDPLTGRIRDFSWLADIGRPVRVLVDDSHGIGLLGAEGEGVSALLPALPRLKYLLCFSLSKAFSCQGGGVAGPAEEIARVKALPAFSAATPMSPAFAYAWMACRPLFDRQRRRLRENQACLHELIRGLSAFRLDPRLPVCYTAESGFYAFSLERKILLSAFRYPTASDPLAVRAVINALHTPGDLKRLADTMGDYAAFRDRQNK